MKVLLVGYSSIAKRKVIPALKRLGIDEIHVATSRPSNAGKYESSFRVFDGYEKGIDESDADLVYISTVNSAHYSQASRALSQGKHVVVDKPLALSLDEVESLVEQAATRNVLLSESAVWGDHLRIQGSLEKLAEHNLVPLHLDAAFTIPHLNPDNYRYNPSLGGGVLWDMGAYIVTPGRIFLGEVPLGIEAFPAGFRNGLITALRIQALYSNGRTFSGLYGFGYEYQNQMRLSGENFYLDLGCVFTTPADLSVESRLRSANTSTSWAFAADDAFASYLKRMMHLLAHGEWLSEYDKLIQDHQVLDRLQNSINHNLNISGDKTS